MRHQLKNLIKAIDKLNKKTGRQKINHLEMEGHLREAVDIMVKDKQYTKIDALVLIDEIIAAHTQRSNNISVLKAASYSFITSMIGEFI